MESVSVSVLTSRDLVVKGDVHASRRGIDVVELLSDVVSVCVGDEFDSSVEDVIASPMEVGFSESPVTSVVMFSVSSSVMDVEFKSLPMMEAGPVEQSSTSGKHSLSVSVHIGRSIFFLIGRSSNDGRVCKPIVDGMKGFSIS